MITYVKGFRFNQEKIVKGFDLKGGVLDPEVKEYERSIISNLNREAYDKICAAYEDTGDEKKPSPWFIVIALDADSDKKALEAREMKELEWTLKMAAENVLDGPDIWKCDDY